VILTAHLDGYLTDREKSGLSRSKIIQSALPAWGFEQGGQACAE
jgi:hypothetical protein